MFTASSRQSILSALLALAALTGLPAGCGKAAPPAASQVVAQVNDGEISVHQINQLLRARAPGLPASQAQAAGRAALEGLIEQEVAVQKALELKLDRDPDVMQTLAATRRDTLARAWVERLAGGATPPDAATLRAYFDARPALFTQRRIYDLQEIVVPVTAEQFERLRQRLAGARKAEDMIAFLRAERLVMQASRTTQPAESLQPALLEQLARMRDGQAVLMGAPGAARIVVLIGSREAPLGFEQARPAIEQVLMTERRREAVRAGIESARRASQVRYIGDFAKPASAPPAVAAAAAASAGGADADSVTKGLAGLR